MNIGALKECFNEMVCCIGAADFTDGADDAEEYAYDANGNMTMDRNKGIERVTYDHNNLPNEILLKSRKSCRYTYDSSGRKLRAEYRTPRNMIPKASSADAEALAGGVDRYVGTTIEYCSDNVYETGRISGRICPTDISGTTRCTFM